MNPIYRSITDLDWMTILLVVSLILLSVGKYFFKTSFFNFIILPFNNKYISLNKKKGKILQGFHVIMSLFQIINLALFFFVARNTLQDQHFGAYTEFYLVIALCLMVFFTVKILLQLANGYFFENSELMTGLIFEKLTYFNYGGLIAFAGNVLMIYVFPEFVPLVYIIILVLLAVNVIGLARILRNHQKLIAGNIFYFILYLCTLEISPIAIIISYLNS
jgi:hypothetical protein